jgi:predicted Zn finger-like uncharacterized protein
MYTRCPNCQTYFKISADHLKKAGGKVRCGQCMKVFNSLGNLLEELPVSLQERTRPANAPKPKPAAKPAAAPKPQAAPAPRPAPTATPSAPPPAKPTPPPPRAEATPPPPAAPRATARPAPTPPTRVPAGAKAPAVAAAPSEPVFVVEAPPEEKTLIVDAEPMPSLDLNAPSDTLDLNSEDQVQNLDVGPHSSVRDLIPYPGPIGDTAAPAMFSDVFFGAGVVTLLIVFILQYSYFMRDDLARYDELRPWVQTMCGVLNCDLPMQQNVDLIKLTHRDITVHPRVKGALLINAVFVNTAGYTQPFPLMQITLSDVGGRVIAKRRFQPAEYLDADVNLRRGMLSNTPIQIVLEIADPGKDAENFEFNFFYPQPS